MNHQVFNTPQDFPAAIKSRKYLPPLTTDTFIDPNFFSDFYALPGSEFQIIDLPGYAIETEMQLSSIPRPYAKTVRYVHSGISPRFSEGEILLDSTGADIHHILKKSYVKADPATAREKLPFNGAVRKTFDLLTTPQSEEEAYVVARLGGRGHMLMNLIPLEYSFHHIFIEMRPYDHIVRIRLDKNKEAKVSIPELLMSFTIFNLSLRMPYLEKFLQANKEKTIQDLNTLEDGKPKLVQQYHLSAWNQMLRELPLIKGMAAEIKMEHPLLYIIWRGALELGGITEAASKMPIIEQ
jgi:hypothetical protein